MIRPRQLFLILVAACGTGIAANAGAEIQIGTRLDPKAIPMGSKTQLQIRVAGSGKHGKPVLKCDPSVKIQGGQEQRFSLQGFGSRRSQFDITYVYSLTPTKTGEFKIEVEVPVAGDALLADPITLTVRNPTAADRRYDPFLKLAVDKPTLYIGESIPLEVTLFVQKDTRYDVQQNAPVVEGENFVIDNFTGPWQAKNQHKAAQNYVPYTYKSTISALKPGEFTLGPGKFECIVRVPAGYSRQFKRYSLTSDALKITVKDIPREGQPDAFGGAVGSFTMNLDADPLELVVGEPISVNLNVGGVGNLDAVQMPKFSADTGWKKYPSKKFENTNRKTRAVESLTFSQVLVPLGQHAEIPAYEFTFFDPDREEYVTLRTDPVPVEIRADPGATLVPNNPESPGFAALPDASTPVESMEDILTIRFDEEAAAFERPRPIYQSPVFWAAQSAPLAALAGIFILFIRRRGPGKRSSDPGHVIPALSDRLDSLRALPPECPSRDFYDAAFACIESWEHHSGSIAALDAESDEDRALLRELTEIRQRHDFLNYAGSEKAGEQAVPASKHKPIIETLERLEANEDS